MPAAVARAIESKPLARRVLADDAYETLKALIFGPVQRWLCSATH